MVLHFERTTKKLRMNTTNQRALIDAFGDELQSWIWEWVTLRDGKTSNGKRTILIARGSPPKPATQPPAPKVDKTTGEIADPANARKEETTA